MKKLICAWMAAAMLVPMSVCSFAIASDSHNVSTPAVLSASLDTISGAPIDGDGKQLKTTDGITPDQTIYFMIPDHMGNYFTDEDAFRIRVKKDRNSKLIKSVSLVEKKLTTSLNKYQIPNGRRAHDEVESNKRHTYLAVALNDTTSSNEFKVEFTATFTARRDLKNVSLQYGNGANNPVFAREIKSGDKIELKGAIWVQNKQDDGNASITVGSKGVTVKPLKNDDNEVVFEGSDTMASLYFRTSSNPDSFFAKLSTKWSSTELSYFKNTDAVMRKFSPASIDAISRATLMLNNPFDERVDPDDVYIYSIDSRGKPTDVTSRFEYDPNEDAFVTKTRTLGTWVISDRKIKLRK